MHVSQLHVSQQGVRSRSFAQWGQIWFYLHCRSNAISLEESGEESMTASSKIPLPSETLTASRIWQAIDEVCQEIVAARQDDTAKVSTAIAVDDDVVVSAATPAHWSLRRASESDLREWKEEVGSLSSTPIQNGVHPHRVQCGDGVTLLYGILVTCPSASGDGSAPEQEEGWTAYATFYMAYSTWEGRVLFLDRIVVGGKDANTDQYNQALVDSLLRRAMARVATRLECARFVWQEQWDDAEQVKASSRPPSSVALVPEHLKGWLTLHWDRSAMESFLVESVGANRGTVPAIAGLRMTQRAAVKNALEALQDPTSGNPQHKSTRLRLAESLEDVEVIGRLVQGLADFEKEPEAVRVTTNHYRLDGGFDGRSIPPLFYCVLMDAIGEDSVEHPYTFGMALINVQESLNGGRFLYLEDLFIEEPYRGMGGGSLTMKALASVSVSMGCSKMVWQALDWNTPALTFYGKLGAKVQVGLETLRYTGTALQELAQW
jgi:GNAT superfamily N-acetyltransferase